MRTCVFRANNLVVRRATELELNYIDSDEFKSEGPYDEHVDVNLSLETFSGFVWTQRKTKKTCVVLTERIAFRIRTDGKSGVASERWKLRKVCAIVFLKLNCVSDKCIDKRNSSTLIIIYLNFIQIFVRCLHILSAQQTCWLNSV